MDDLARLQALRYLEHFSRIMASKVTIRPRGLEVREVSDLQLIVIPDYPFMTFSSRKYPMDYFRKEMMWKLGANPYDESIKKAAKMWENVQNPDKTFNSNYGVYWFGPQGGIWSVVTELIRDPDSRRAVIPMLSAAHMTPQTVDTVCTEAVGFRIRDRGYSRPSLDMSVHMRSSDAVFGLGTDIATFAFLYRLVLALVDTSLNVGEMKITAMSAHIYSNHYGLVQEIIDKGADSFAPIGMPYCASYDEAMYIISKRGKMSDIPADFTLARWLNGELD